MIATGCYIQRCQSSIVCNGIWIRYDILIDVVGYLSIKQVEDRIYTVYAMDVHYNNTFQHPSLRSGRCRRALLIACLRSYPFIAYFYSAPFAATASASVVRPRHFTNSLNAIGPKGLFIPYVM